MRSPLVRLLRRLHRQHRQSLGAASSTGSAVSRRAFLAGSATLTAAAACPTPTPPPASPQVAIVGGGLAGLSCAHRLAGLGLDNVVVFEAQNRLGGRVLSDRATFGPLHCELGGELIDTGHETMFDLVDEFGLGLIDYNDDDDALDSIVAFFGGARVDVAALLAAYAPIAARIDADLATISGDGFVTYDAPNDGEALDNLSIRAWFDGLVADGVIDADNIARRLFEVAYNIEYGRETNEQSALNMLFLTSTSTTDLALFGDSDELFKIAGGNDAIVTALAAGKDIETERKLTAVRRNAAGRFVLSFERGGDVDADHVVLALPFTMLREVDLDASLDLSRPKRDAIAQLGYGTNSKLMLGFASRFWRNGQGDNTSNGETYSDTGYQATWETSRLQEGTEGVLTNFTGGLRGAAAGDGSPAERAAEFLAEFETIFPGVTADHNGKLARFHWPTNAFVKASYSCYLPGQYSTIAGAEGEAEADGTLHFCGEHTSLDFQGYMEGAALSGAVSAVAIAEAAGVDVDGQALAATPAARTLSRARTVRQHRRLRRRR
jgi:monoamine oxidase